MRKLNDAIDRFCAMHPRLGIPGLMRYIVIANAAIYIFSLFDRSGLLLSVLAMDIWSVLHGQIWRIVTFVLIPTGDRPLSVLLSLFFYFWLGESMERLWGSAKFTVYYVSGMLLSVIASILALFLDGFAFPLYGAGYVNSALFFAYALTYPEAIVRIFYIIPIKMKWLAIFEAVVYAAAVVYGIVLGAWGYALTPIVAMLNLFVFFSPDFYRRADTVRAHNRREAVQFRKAVKEQQRQKGYNHKCEVCGRTDTEYPNLQFRYCSKCSGYHCFCEEHIFNHTHHME
ncbi:MAG: rhomboid family intramembrane serine protease [Oscillospiraceae bacterium]|nr:rhomboid family intramembrane serine protease [Oscillospiraceae bacterium]